MLIHFLNGKTKALCKTWNTLHYVARKSVSGCPVNSFLMIPGLAEAPPHKKSFLMRFSPYQMQKNYTNIKTISPNVRKLQKKIASQLLPSLSFTEGTKARVLNEMKVKFVHRYCKFLPSKITAPH